jgi:hypothetical protein
VRSRRVTCLLRGCFDPTKVRLVEDDDGESGRLVMISLDGSTSRHDES